MYLIEANIRGQGCEISNIACFDPTVIIWRLKEKFPEVEVQNKDVAWRDYESFLGMGVAEGDPALQTAERDAQRRGPRWLFRFPALGGSPMNGMNGRAERYYVGIMSHGPIPEPLRTHFIEFLQTLRFSDDVVVSSCRLEGNDSFPA